MSSERLEHNAFPMFLADVQCLAIGNAIMLCVQVLKGSMSGYKSCLKLMPGDLLTMPARLLFAALPHGKQCLLTHSCDAFAHARRPLDVKCENVIPLEHVYASEADLDQCHAGLR